LSKIEWHTLWTAPGRETRRQAGTQAGRHEQEIRTIGLHFVMIPHNSLLCNKAFLKLVLYDV